MPEVAEIAGRQPCTWPDGVIYGAGFGRGNAELLREAADRQGYRLELVKKEPSQ